MKMKVIFLFLLMLLISGCKTVNDLTIQDIAANIGKKIDNYNTYRTGYKYYLPSGMNVTKSALYNEEIAAGDMLFYLYADVISYYNKVENDYKINNDAYFSARLTSEDKSGYLEINFQENDQYLIEIMFNYAKIEVMVDYEKINLALDHAVSILRSIEYNDVVIASLIEDDILSFKEEEYNIFNTSSSDSEFLQKLEEDTYVEEEKIEDSDLIN